MVAVLILVPLIACACVSRVAKAVVKARIRRRLFSIIRRDQDADQHRAFSHQFQRATK